MSFIKASEGPERNFKALKRISMVFQWASRELIEIYRGWIYCGAVYLRWLRDVPGRFPGLTRGFRGLQRCFKSTSKRIFLNIHVYVYEILSHGIQLIFILGRNLLRHMR